MPTRNRGRRLHRRRAHVARRGTLDDSAADVLSFSPMQDGKRMLVGASVIALTLFDCGGKVASVGGGDPAPNPPRSDGEMDPPRTDAPADPSDALLALLPTDNEVGAWTRSDEPVLVANESALYNQIDGATPKYIDHGWVRGVFGQYRQGSRALRVFVHDMGNDANALAIFNDDRPASAEAVRPDVLLDTGLGSSYATKAHTGRFYVEVSIDEKSDASKVSIELFTIELLDHGK